MAITFFNWTSGTAGDYLLNLAYLQHQGQDLREASTYTDFDQFEIFSNFQDRNGFVMGNNQWGSRFNMIELSTEEDWISSRFIHDFKLEWNLPWKEIEEESNELNKHVIIQTHGLRDLINSTLFDHDKDVIYRNSVNLYTTEETEDFIKNIMHFKSIDDDREETDSWIDEENNENLHDMSADYSYYDVFFNEDHSHFHSLLEKFGVDLYSDETTIAYLNESRRLYVESNKESEQIYKKSISSDKKEYIKSSKNKEISFSNYLEMVMKQDHLLLDLKRWNQDL